MLRVTRGGFYQWVHKPMSDRDIEDRRLLGVICDSYAVSSGVYGARRVFGDLREAGETLLSFARLAAEYESTR